MSSKAPGPDTLLAGVDVGGGSVKLGVLARDGSAREERVIALEGRPAAELLAEVGHTLRALAGARDPAARIAAVGVGLPGLLEREQGCVSRSPNLPWLVGVPVRRLLAAALGLAAERVLLENDANVAALGEQWLGAARGERHLLLLTLGTGIGGGLILDGKLFVGAGQAGEPGHLTLDPRGPPCGCGSRGCLELYASGSAARRRALARGLPAEAPGDLELLAERARQRGGAERALLEEVGYDLGRGLAAVLVLLDLRTFVFGGGFSAAFDVLEAGVRRALAEWAYGERVASVRLLPAQLGASAGWIGAARLALG